MLPDDPITAYEGRLQLGMGEPASGMTLEVPTGVEPGCCAGVDLEVAGFERSTHCGDATPAAFPRTSAHGRGLAGRPTTGRTSP